MNRKVSHTPAIKYRWKVQTNEREGAIGKATKHYHLRWKHILQCIRSDRKLNEVDNSIIMDNFPTPAAMSTVTACTRLLLTTTTETITPGDECQCRDIHKHDIEARRGYWLDY